MSSDILREDLHRVPFHPIIVWVPSGRTVTSTNAELATFKESGHVPGVFEGERLTLIDVAAAEATQTTAGEQPRDD